MKKIIIAPDSFKGTLSSVEVCEIIEKAANEIFKSAETIKLPIADGGEGTVDAFVSIFGGKNIFSKAHSPLGRLIEARYALLPSDIAVIETAQASGITTEKANNALKASTFGTGELIRDALDRGAKEILLGLGGSATTDGGIGCAAALGARFLDDRGEEIPLCGEGLLSLRNIDLSGMDERLKTVHITALCDVKNPLFGETGAAYVYAPQKGASDLEVKMLDEGLRKLASITSKSISFDFSNSEGAGAAGGLGFGCMAFLGGKLKSGIDAVLDGAEFECLAADADLIVTGEGRMDFQSLMGKAPFGVAKRANGKKVIAIVGVMDADMIDARRLGISETFETNGERKPFEEVKMTAAEDLYKTAVAAFESLKKRLSAGG